MQSQHYASHSLMKRSWENYFGVVSTFNEGH